MRLRLTFLVRVILLSPLLLVSPPSEAQQKPALAASTLFDFSRPDMKGYIRATGHHHGLIITQGADGRPVTKDRMCTLNLEHYSETGRSAPFLPRNERLHTFEREGDRVTLIVSATDEWSIQSRVLYDLTHPDHITVTFSFEFQRDFSKFEAFVASYMADWTPPLIKCGGEWMRPFPEKRFQMFVPKDDEVAAWPPDGRWGWFPESLKPKVSGLRYDIPVLVSRDDKSGWAMIQMVDPDGVRALSPNTFAPAHDLCLVGRDVRAGEKVSVPVRLLYRQVERMEQVEAWYGEFLTDLGKSSP